METTLIIALCFSGIFTFAFGVAWALPLRAEISKAHELTPQIHPVEIVRFACIYFPLLWIFLPLVMSSAERKLAHQLWRKERSIRTSFYTFLVCFIASVALGIALYVLGN